MTRLRIPIAFLVAALGLGGSALAAGAEATPSAQVLAGLRFRTIGPAVMGGRIHDVEALAGDPATIYVASATGGLWRSTNKGATWAPLFDEQPVSTFGDLAIAPGHPEILWAGTGEQNNRQSTSWGDGVYRSTDGGKSWTHLGLSETRHIGRVVVDPRNPDVAYVAALGNLWKASPDRGVYKTTDGGRTWKKLLFVDETTGVVDVVMDPSAPDTLYAAAYQRMRTAWGFNGGGPGSGLYKTTDGGLTWRKLAAGLPAGDKGRIGLAIARTNPKVLVALLEHERESGVYRSEDAGETWTRVSTTNPRPMYYSHVFIDPTTDQRVYILAVSVYKSEDGGKTFGQLPTAPTYDVGTKGDFHSLWIDPREPKHFYLAGDGGLQETWDMGQTFLRLNNIPIGQFYAIGVDDRQPYFIYGGMQDDHSWMGPSAGRHWLGIINEDWREIGFGDGMYHQVDLAGPRYVYSTAQNGEIQRVDAFTGDRLDIRPQPPAGEPPYRWDWITPILASRHTPGTVYFGGNRLFISRDRGVTWTRTEDLTRQVDREALPIMGVRGADIRLSRHDGEQSYSEITVIAESPLEAKVLWVGTDDGNVQVSRDGGGTWKEVSRNAHGAPDGASVSRIVASGSALGAAWLAFDHHRAGDVKPYLFRTTDHGASWTPLVSGLPTDGPVKALVEYPGKPDVVFLGTEHALFASTDTGRTWTRFMPNLPTTRYDDLLIHPRTKDLVVATHGRGLWILDDVSPLAEWSEAAARGPVHLFAVRTATEFQYWEDFSYRGNGAYAGENPADGALVSYYLARPASSVRLTVTSASGRVVQTLEGPTAGGAIHRVAWDLRHDRPPMGGGPGGGAGGGGEPGEGGGGAEGGGVAARAALPRPTHPVGPRGPFVSPGVYTLTLEADGTRATRTVEVKADPELPITLAQHKERETFLLEVMDLQRRLTDLTDRMTRVRTTLDAPGGGPLPERRASLNEGRGSAPAAEPSAKTPATARVEKRLESLTSLERLLRGGRGGLRGALSGLADAFNGQGVRQGSLYPPTAAHRQRLAELKAEVDKAEATLRAVEEGP